MSILHYSGQLGYLNPHFLFSSWGRQLLLCKLRRTTIFVRTRVARPCQVNMTHRSIEWSENCFACEFMHLHRQLLIYGGYCNKVADLGRDCSIKHDFLAGPTSRGGILVTFARSPWCLSNLSGHTYLLDDPVPVNLKQRSVHLHSNSYLIGITCCMIDWIL